MVREGRSISVIIPVYNKEKTLHRCIDSVLKQTYSDFELILVNDGSADDSEKICASYLKDERIIMISQENQGVSAARNAGLEIATGKYITLIDADDEIDQLYLEKLVKEMEAGYDLAVCGKIEKSWNHNQNIRSFSKSSIDQIDKLDVYFSVLFQTDFFTSSVGRMIVKDRIKNPFDEQISFGEDVNFMLDYLERCQRISIIEDCLYIYHIQKESLTTQLHQNELEIIEKINRRFIQFYDSKIKGTNRRVIQQYACNSLVMLAQKAVQNKEYEVIQGVLKNPWAVYLIENEEGTTRDWNIMKTKSYIKIVSYFRLKLTIKRWVKKA